MDKDCWYPVPIVGASADNPVPLQTALLLAQTSRVFLYARKVTRRDGHLRQLRVQLINDCARSGIIHSAAAAIRHRASSAFSPYMYI